MYTYYFVKNSFKLFCKYIIHWLKGKSKQGHGIHSPFVYSFVRNVVRPGTKDDTDIETIRKSLMESSREIYVSDLGAGSIVANKSVRTIRSMARHSTNKKINKLLHRLVAFVNPDYIVELGTSIGFGSMYMAKATKSIVYTVEGDPGIAEIARQNFNKLNLNNIHLINSEFDEALSVISGKLSGKGLFFIDGNHTFSATLKYFNYAIKHLQNDGVLIIDDIYWSNGMQKAWKRIVESSQVPLTIDLFHVGIVIVNKKLYKQHYIIKY